MSCHVMSCRALHYTALDVTSCILFHHYYNLMSIIVSTNWKHFATRDMIYTLLTCLLINSRHSLLISVFTNKSSISSFRSRVLICREVAVYDNVLRTRTFGVRVAGRRRNNSGQQWGSQYVLQDDPVWRTALLRRSVQSAICMDYWNTKLHQLKFSLSPLL